jgi:proline dehydrogenase
MSLFDRVVVGIMPLMPRSLVGRVSRRYIAGPSLGHAIETVRSLNAAGLMATLDVLGENTQSLDQAGAVRQVYLETLQEIDRTGVDSNVSLKPTQFGLKVDREACYRSLRSVVERSGEQARLVRIDMEDSSCTNATLELYRGLRRDFENVGVVLQAMLRRTLRDAEDLARTRANVRLCKGIYLEPKHVAFTDRESVNRNYVQVLERLLEAGCYVGVATHDERLVEEAQRLIQKFGLKREQYEFQMLLGVGEGLRRKLVDQGHRLRVYVPFGEQWYSYSMRRLRENPRIAGYVARAILRRDRRPPAGEWVCEPISR